VVPVRVDEGEGASAGSTRRLTRVAIRPGSDSIDPPQEGGLADIALDLSRVGSSVKGTALRTSPVPHPIQDMGRGLGPVTVPRGAADLSDAQLRA